MSTAYSCTTLHHFITFHYGLIKECSVLTVSQDFLPHSYINTAPYSATYMRLQTIFIPDVATITTWHFLQIRLSPRPRFVFCQLPFYCLPRRLASGSRNSHYSRIFSMWNDRDVLSAVMNFTAYIFSKTRRGSSIRLMPRLIPHCNVPSPVLQVRQTMILGLTVVSGRRSLDVATFEANRNAYYLLSLKITTFHSIIILFAGMNRGILSVE